MATIPDPNQIQRRPGSTGTSVVRAAGNPMPEAMDRLSGDLGGLMEKRNELELSKARNQFRIASMQALSRQDERADYSNIEPDWDDETRKALAYAAQGITDIRVREEFVGSAEVDREQDRVKVQDLVYTKAKDKEHADLYEMEQEYRKGAAVVEPERMQELVSDMQFRYQAMVNAGWLDRDEAAQREQLWKNKVAVDRVTAMEPEEQVEVFNTQPSWLRNLDETTYARLKKDAEREVARRKALGEAKKLLALDDAAAFQRLLESDDVDQFDATYDRYQQLRAAEDSTLDTVALPEARRLFGLSSDAATAELEKITDPDLRNEVRTVLGQLREDRARNLQDRQDDLYDNLMPGIWRGDVRVENGVVVDKEGNRSPLEAGWLTPAQYDNLRREQDDRDKRLAGKFVPTWSNDEVRAKLEDLILNDKDGTLAQAQLYYGENSSKLNIADRRYYAQKFQIARAEQSGSSVAGAEEFKALENTRQLMDRKIKEFGINDVGVTSRLWDRLRDWNQQYYLRNQRNPTDTEIREQLSLEFINIRRDPDAWIMDEDIYVYDMPADQRDAFFQAVEVMRAANPYISREEVIKRYENMLRERRRRAD